MSSIRKRGAHSWEVRVDVGPRDPVTGKRKVASKSVRGTKRDALLAAAQMTSAAATGGIADPSRVTVAEFLTGWLTDWAQVNVSAKTAERFEGIIRCNIAPHIGTIRLQKLSAASLAGFYAKLRKEGRKDGKGLSTRSVGHVHRVLHRALGHAATWQLVTQNVAALVEPPRVEATEIAIVRDVEKLLSSLRTRSIYPIASLALATGMRRGECLALRWIDCDLDRGLASVERSLELTKACGVRFKAPKTKYGRRSITLPATVVTELRDRRRQEQEQRLALGLGRLPDDALVFHRLDGGPLHPNAVTKEWDRAMKAIGLTAAFHSLRHSHASQLIAAGVDAITVSRRLGHGSPSITLNLYGHWFGNTDYRAAVILERTFSNAARTE